MTVKETGAPNESLAVLNPEQYRIQLETLNGELQQSWQRLESALSHWFEGGEFSIPTDDIAYKPLVKLKSQFGLTLEETYILLLCFLLVVCRKTQIWWEQKTGNLTLTRSQYIDLLNGKAQQEESETQRVSIQVPLLQDFNSRVFNFQLLELRDTTSQCCSIVISNWAKDWLSLSITPGQGVMNWVALLPYRDKSHLNNSIEPLLEYWQQVMEKPQDKQSIACFEIAPLKVNPAKTLAAMAAYAYKVPSYQVNTSLILAANATELVAFYWQLSRDLLVFQSVCLVDLTMIKDIQSLHSLMLRLLPCFEDYPANFILFCTPEQRTELDQNVTCFSTEVSDLHLDDHQIQPKSQYFNQWHSHIDKN